MLRRRRRPLPGQQLRLRHPPRRRARGRRSLLRLAPGHRPAGRRRRASCPAASATATISGPAPSPGSARSWQAVQRHAAGGGPVLGICNGFQILCEAHLLPGRADAERRPALRRQAGGRDGRADRHRRSPPRTPPAQRLRLPVAHGEGRFVADETPCAMLEAEGRVVLRYVADTEGSPCQPQPQRLGRAHRRASATPPATWSASCRTPSAPPSRCSAWPMDAGFFLSMAAWQPRPATAKVLSR